MTVEPITLVKDAAACCGCGACMAVCALQAITMEEDPWGVLYPKIDPSKCIQCGRCLKICPYHETTTGNPPAAVYAAVGSCDETVKNSASGGIFASLAAACLQKGGLAAGAVLDCENSRAEVYHLLSDTQQDLGRMQGSKYVQSRAWRCYPQVQSALEGGKTVLFSGTPCQVAAVKALTGDPSNLVTVDIICHGVPSEKMLNDYLNILARRLRGTITDFRFRDKTCQKQFAARIDLAGKKTHGPVFLKSSLLSFYTHFLKGTFYRENCYSCPYACSQRISDITMGDYWGVEQHHGPQIGRGEMPNRKDWSCLLVNTEKGAAFLKDHGEEILLYPSRLQWVAENNQQLNAPAKPGKDRDRLMALYQAAGYEAVEKAFLKERGGALRVLWRMFRNIRENSRMVKQYEN